MKKRGFVCAFGGAYEPSNDATYEVSQELVALLYAVDAITTRRQLGRAWPWFRDGVCNRPRPEVDSSARTFWEAGMLARHIIAIGGQS